MLISAYMEGYQVDSLYSKILSFIDSKFYVIII